MFEILNLMKDEIETVIRYKAVYLKTVECDLCKSTINDIANEEFVHIGECIGVLKIRHPEVYSLIMQGVEEVADESMVIENPIEADKAKPMIEDLVSTGNVHP